MTRKSQIAEIDRMSLPELQEFYYEEMTTLCDNILNWQERNHLENRIKKLGGSLTIKIKRGRG